MAKHKIWWQSSMRGDGFPDYIRAIEEHAEKYLSDDFEVEVHGVPYGTNALGYLSFKQMNDYQVLNNMMQARDRGFDAIALGCYQDPAMEEIREMLDVPVMGMGQTSLLWSQMYAKTPCIVTYDRLAAAKSMVRVMEANHMEGIGLKPLSFDMPVEAAVLLHEENHFVTSRGGYYEKPAEDLVDEARQIYFSW